MSSEREELREPLPDFVAEVANETAQHSAGAAALSKNDLEVLLTRFTSFESSAPVDQGYERILVTKGPNWVPASGRSVKPGNLRFNLGTLFEAIASGVASGFAAATVPIVAVFTGLVAIRKLGKAIEVELSERDALVIWSIWSCEQRAASATDQGVHQLALQEARRVGSTVQPSMAEIQQSLERLEKIGAIHRAENRTWETIEAVIVRT